ncbi:MAG: hypothetical protein P5680_27210, partial [Limnospira sp. PMC 737.11]|uniref:hypothetical protein n=1 Tax=Limnospira sp. PMC 737.11 TaxID=2981095 RepID=UPI0028E0F9FA
EVTTTTASLTVTGTGGLGTDSNDGVQVAGTGTRIASVDGLILIDGVGRGTGDQNRGVQVVQGALIETTG